MSIARLTALGSVAVLATSVAVAAALPANAATSATTATHPAHEYGRAGAVFVQLNALGGNEIAAFSRAADGHLTPAGRYATGGRGGTAVGAPVDALASQGSLTLTAGGHVLLAVNAGSDTVTSFEVHGTRLHRESVAASGGAFPVSVTARGDLVYVLDAGGSGTVAGFRLRGARLVPIPGSSRSLGLSNTTPPAFLSAPAQVGITPDGRAVVVTTKANNTIEGFGVRPDGRLSATPKITPASGPVPFAIEWAGARTLYVAQAGDGRVVTYTVHSDGSTTLRGAADSSAQKALCWLVRAGSTLVGANPGSASLSTWSITERHGVATLRRASAATPGGAPIDVAASRDGRFVFVQDAVSGTVTVDRVDGSALTGVQTVTGLPTFAGGQGMEGIAAS